MISKWEKAGFWLRWFFIVFSHLVVAVLGFPLFPLAYFLRHKVGLEGRKNPLWFLLNYTEDNDWGLSHYKDNPPKKTFWNALKWYFRNSAWNYKILFKPKWWAGEVDAFESVKYTLPEGHNRFTRASKELRIYGVNHCYYKIGGTTYGRYSFAQPVGFIKEFNVGTSGNRYLFKLKL